MSSESWLILSYDGKGVVCRAAVNNDMLISMIILSKDTIKRVAECSLAVVCGSDDRNSHFVVRV